MGKANNWMSEAEQYAKTYSDNIKKNNQYLIDQLTQAKTNNLAQLEAQQQNNVYNLNTNKSTINKTAEDNARQLDVARLLALKSNQQSLNRAGLGTQGVVGSQVNSINNNYNTNLSSVLNDKATALRDLESQKQDSLLQYNTNRLNLENEYNSNLANLQSSIDDKALSQYNTIYSNYLNQKQQEYDNEQAELARQEAIRQYNENLALQKAQLEYQKQQDAISNAQKWAQINAEKTNNTSYTFDDDTKLQDSTIESYSTDELANLYSTYNWKNHINKELFRYANGGFGGLNQTDKEKIASGVVERVKSGEMTDDEGKIIMYALQLQE